MVTSFAFSSLIIKDFEKQQLNFSYSFPIYATSLESGEIVFCMLKISSLKDGGVGFSGELQVISLECQDSYA